MWYHSRSGLCQATANHCACVRTLPAPPTLPCNPVDWAAGEVFLFPLCREGSLGSVMLSVLPELPSMCCDLGCITLPMLQFPLPERAQVPSLPLHVDIPGDRGHTGAVGFLGPVSPLVPSSEPSSLVWPPTAWHHILWLRCLGRLSPLTPTCEPHTAGHQLHQVAECSAGESVGTSQSLLPLGFPIPPAYWGALPSAVPSQPGRHSAPGGRHLLDPRSPWPLPRKPCFSLTHVASRSQDSGQLLPRSFYEPFPTLSALLLFLMVFKLLYVWTFLCEAQRLLGQALCSMLETMLRNMPGWWCGAWRGEDQALCSTPETMLRNVLGCRVWMEGRGQGRPLEEAAWIWVLKAEEDV